MRSGLFLIAFALLPVFSRALSSRSIGTNEYEAARIIRAKQGHDAAVHHFRDLLRMNPDDLSAATRLSAASGELWECLQHRVGSVVNDALIKDIREWFRQSDYTAAGVKQLLEINEPFARAPIYVSPASPGNCNSLPFSQSTLTSLQLQVSLFLLGIAVPEKNVGAHHRKYLEMLQAEGMVGRCEVDPSIWVALISVMPLDMDDGTTLLIVTDWHPRVLNTIHIGKEQPVMYIGPDSLALVQHFVLDPATRISRRLLDLCTGSGVQALAFCQFDKGKRTAVVSDINPRALRFVRFNAALNDLSDQIEDYVEIDLVNNANELLKLKHFDLITANPPFLPVPPSYLDLHGLFSAGGDTGEVVLESVMNVSPLLLNRCGVLAVVSEFFLGDDNDSSHLVERLKRYWGVEGQGLLLTNENPIGRDEYARRRGNEPTWVTHLQEHGIYSCSPGLLYVKMATHGRLWDHVVLPTSKMGGSIWTPWNSDAVVYTRQSTSERLW